MEKAYICIFTNLYLKLVCVCVSPSVMSDSLQPCGQLSTRLLCWWNSPAKNTGVDCHSLLHGIFLTQGSNLGVLHFRQILHQLSQERSLKLSIPYIKNPGKHKYSGINPTCDFVSSGHQP